MSDLPAPAAGLKVMLDPPVGRILLDRPRHRNAMTFGMLEGIVTAAEFFNARGDVKVVVVSGAGGDFTAGMDLQEFVGLVGDAGRMRDGAELGARMCDALESIEAVTMAVISGHCIGGGVLMAAACDLRIAADDAHFAIPELWIGIPFTWRGVPRLMREIGPGPARDLILTGRRFQADEARQIGLLSRVVESARLAEAADDLIAGIATRSRFALIETKRLMRRATSGLLDAHTIGIDSHLIGDATADEESASMIRRYIEMVAGGGSED